MNRVAKQQGFTLIELMLAMAFVSALLLAIAMTVIQVGTIYSRGMMLKEVNQTSRELSTDFARAIDTKGELTLATDYVQIESSGLAIGGRLCLGTISYLWNYGEALQEESPELTLDADGEPIRIAKVVDTTRKYCQKNAGALVVRDIEAVDAPQTSELLREGDRTLELYQLDIVGEPTAYDGTTRQQLYTIQYTIGSGAYTALNDDRTACKGPNEPGSDLQYCAVEQFSLVVRARG